MNVSKLQRPLIALILRAGKAVLKIYQQSGQLAVQLKPDHSPLTQADLTAHQIIMAGLRSLTPTLPILSEEGLNIPWRERQTWDSYWLIDPLDGTRQFISRGGEFTINIALIKDHKPIVGLLYVPISQETYYASEQWGGAYKLDAQERKVRLRVRAWQPNATAILTSETTQDAQVQQLVGHLGAYTQIKMSSAWKFARLAEGKADLSPRLGDTSEWDTAAGQCILEQAGGAIVNLQGQALRYNTHSSVINPHFIALGDEQALAKRLFK